MVGGGAALAAAKSLLELDYSLAFLAGRSSNSNSSNDVNGFLVATAISSSSHLPIIPLEDCSELADSID